MTTTILVVLALVLIVVVVLLMTQKKPEELPPKAEPKKLEEPVKSKRPRAPSPEKRPEGRAEKEATPGRDATVGREKEPAEKAPKPEAMGVVDQPPTSAAPSSPPGAGEARLRPAEPTELPATAKKEAPPPSKKRVSVKRPSTVEGLRQGLAKSRETTGFFGRLRALFAGKREISPELAEQIEEVLLGSDVGVKTTQTILERLRETMRQADLVDSSRVWDALRAEAVRILEVNGKAGPMKLGHTPTVVLMVGVNGSGKTTTIGKLATRLQEQGHRSVLAAGDTFRAAAVQQLVIWGERVGCEVVRGKDGADPSSVIFDSIKKAQEVGADIVLADTAGRLHTKRNLMSELKKIAKTADKALPGAPHEILLVIDATNGQNALSQAKEFKEALDVTGLVLTKLDGTAKGGMVLGICDELELPVRFVGLGERAQDLHDFLPDEFVEALLGKESEASAAQ